MEAPALPEVVPIQASRPCSLAKDTPIAEIRSLYDPVGFEPSILKYNCSRPSFRPMLLLGISGVCPSPKVIWFPADTCGNCCSYFHIPCLGCEWHGEFIG